jgi:hypothetical protein
MVNASWSGPVRSGHRARVPRCESALMIAASTAVRALSWMG